MQDSVQKWVEISEYDLTTAQAMFESGRYLYVAFMCQQAVEKILKAIYTQKKKSIAPRTHSLLYLIDTLELTVTDQQKLLLSELNQFYLEGRYPNEQTKLTVEVDTHKAGYYLEITREVWTCLKQMLLPVK